MKDPILITGCARSGTSMTSGVIDIGGAFGGNTAGPNKNNKRGMFENLDIRNGLVKPFLRSINADPLGQNPLPDMDIVKERMSIHFVTKWANQVKATMYRHGYHEGEWYYKGAKMCLIWPLWHAAFPDAKWIIVRRDGQDIINSCLKTGFMRAYTNVEGWRSWVTHHHRCFNEMLKEGLNVRQIWPQDMIDGDLRPMRSCISDFLGLEWREQQVLNFIMPALWSNVKRKRKHGTGQHLRG